MENTPSPQFKRTSPKTQQDRHLFERNETRRVGGTDTGSTVPDGFAVEGKTLAITPST